MAKYDPKHTKDVLTFDTTTEDDTVEKHQDRLIKHKERMFEENNTKIKNDLLSTYEEYSEKIEKGTDDEQIQILSRFHQGQSFFKWMLGDFLMKIDEQINSGKKTGYNSLRDFIEKNEPLLGFGKSSGFDYINARKALTIEQFRRIGIRKAVVISSIPDPVKRDEFIQATIETPKITESALKLQVAEYKQNVKQTVQVAKEKERKVINKKIVIDIVEKNGKMILSLHDYETAYLFHAVNLYMPQIKANIKRMIELDENSED